MATEEKKKTLYGGSYDEDLSNLYQQISTRPSFSYDVDGDALYQQYKDRYTQNAKMSMKDTMGQAAALTGGYGSSYGQAVGQQAYDRQMLGLTDMIPQLEQSAYQKYQDKGNELRNQYSMLNSMAATEQQTSQANYNQLASLITSSGYQPTAEELTRAGMNAEQANALRQAWMAANPGAAYMAGQLSADDYFKLTGQYPPDVAAAQKSSGYGGGVASQQGEDKKIPSQVEINIQMRENKASTGDISAWLQSEYGVPAEDAKNMARTAYAQVYKQ